MDFALFVQYALSGITVGSVYAIVAIGFNIIYCTTGIINFAQGEFLIVGAMTAISLAEVAPLPVAILGAVLITTTLGAVVELVFIRQVRNASVLRLIIITIGLSIVMREVMLHIWDEQVRSLPYFTGTEVSTVTILGAHISPQVLWVLGVSAVIVAALTLFFRYTTTGRAMRACADDRMAACLCGVNDRWMVTLSFMLSAGIGALAGCVVSPITQTQYDMGAPLAIKGFTVAILGGMGNSMAAVAAGLFLGLLEAFVVSVLPSSYKEVAAIVVLLLILVFRPSGLFARRDVSALRAA
ncbi:MAG: branched-chain amino acid ABC transporter permease [Sedimentisphaerales bacterium]|jgi:branched-chain amino acid transport system permease protein|nr:branched-chain amino acid ABC transporter permease [Sedimentisphaerales bacterium]HNY78917.1 branched-chain amino acid ABC transporter permease [Sedimentisphaerales bacterium]HOC62667.1 branched-chain amino acid ABC transporter permease [Sedimentisphaerales bacterium]HOH64865.1 branched-chain amino acid ABC transporter permease [Sedimentisphaerales bacterium]HPY48562.1 branched-chain amino acid ABC transporter permease [Sedimentisphaerales bacterium]